MGKTYKEAYRGSKQAFAAQEYQKNKRIKHAKLAPYKRTQVA